MRPRFSYLLPRFGPRLGLGLAGLLAALPLLFAARHTSPAGRAGQGVSPETNLLGSGLSRKLTHQADFSSFTTVPPSGPRSYLYAPTSLYQGRAGRRPRPGRYRLTLRGPGPSHASPPAGPATTGLVARSWRTIKAMFR
ncbi:hypothetical protein HHL22_19560 [Hymenobacter sp. RP-2-7]|uniref:Uncharacterized protein n=1 Tax=Hymenobacter polaris TaxID=2682546 RepID=A0A7Y0AHD3_9BACT|nr:hypothetical protein [Hymenobacter polaris]NML67406.1 hypothetical protein [Hymenobacter polaris]